RGKPCSAQSLLAKEPNVFLIGWEHADDDGIAAIRNLLSTYVRKNDRVIAEITPSEFAQSNLRDRRCMGVAQERCIAGDLEGSSQDARAAIGNAGIATMEFARALDYAAAAEIASKYGDIANVYKLIEACQALIQAKMTGLSNRARRAVD